MMMTHSIVSTRTATRFAPLLGLLLVTAAWPVRAIEVLTASELASHCAVLPQQQDSADGQYCIRYVQGFIDGAVATDAQVMLAADEQRKESFTERAYRTRAPSHLDRQRAARLAGFCLGDPLPLFDVVERVVADLKLLPT